MLKFVDSGLYFVQDENNVINPLLQAGSRFGGPKIKGSGSSSQILPGPTIFGRTQEGGHGSTRLKQVDVDTKTEYDDRQAGIIYIYILCKILRF